jgi:alpha-D-ribose 1-methylphosphonate 5-triphosphate diphosphatase
VLCSDYYYPCLLAAPFALAARGTLDLAAAWRLVSTNPARAAGLTDRGAIAVGQRADLLLVDVVEGMPALRAVLAGGRLVWADAGLAGRLG